LFVNVTLPDMLERVKMLNNKLESDISTVVSLRAHLFEEFSFREINRLHSSFSAEQEKLPDTDMENARIERAVSGIDQLWEYVRRPYISPLNAELVKSQEENEAGNRDPCLEMFDFGRRVNIINDARKMITYKAEINTYLSSAKRNAADIYEQIKSGVDILENRREILESQKPAALEILLPAIGAIIFTGLNFLWKACIYDQRHVRVKILQGTLHRDKYGRWSTRYESKEIKPSGIWGRLKNQWQQSISEPKSKLTPILGVIVGALVWLGYLYFVA
jgi:hypothetical protein